MIETSLVLNSGQIFRGLSPAWMKDKEFPSGELVFNTAMTGYVETLTDPSYANQIIVFTYPHIGNYDVSDKNLWESSKIHAQGVVMVEAYHECKNSFTEWLKDQEIPYITNVDTREITKIIRDGKANLAFITSNKKFQDDAKDFIFDLKVANPAETVRQSIIKEPQMHINSKINSSKTIIVIDCGMKANILRKALDMSFNIMHVPYDYDFTKEKYDGLLLSNGPGDPVDWIETIENLKKAIELKKPIFGICLGHQLLAIASGATTFKMRFGHRSCNQPCLHVKSGKAYLTSQNHGYSVDPRSIKEDWDISFININDDTVEGMRHKTLPFSSVQFHPEAAPGPHDTMWLFQEFQDICSN